MGDYRNFSPEIKKKYITTSFNKRLLYEAILTLIKGHNLLIVAFFIILGILSTSTPILGATIFEDNFDSYSEGNLAGQGDWICDYNYWNIISTTSQSSPNSIINQAISYISQCKKDGTYQTEGSMSFYFKTTNCGYGNSRRESLIFRLSGEPFFSLPNIEVKSTSDMGCQISLSDISTEYVAMDSFNNWTQVRWYWKQQNNYYWFKWGWGENNNTAWIQSIYSVDMFPSGFNRVQISASYGTGGQYFYVDSIGVPFCELGNCGLCEYSETCINAGCFWYDSSLWYPLYLPSYCVEPVEPIPEECGAFWKCPYCDKAGCEAQHGFCEWKDIGFGDKCYMIEPTIPPVQGGWEMPELENCEVLSGVEKWLCEIKNFIAGIFMPTKEKINEFYLTMATFNEKFPFNYTRALSGFFTNIKNGFDEEKNIPVKILGQEGNVNFNFWNANATIGGLSENFKNILKDFSTLLILLAFLVWLIGFIKRFL